MTNYSKALDLDSYWPEALDKLAFLLAAYPEKSIHDPVTAVRLAKRALQLTGHEVPDFIATLAFAHAAEGNFSNAVATAELALKKAQEHALSKLAEQLECDLEFYRVGRLPQKDWRNPTRCSRKRFHDSSEP